MTERRFVPKGPGKQKVKKEEPTSVYNALQWLGIFALCLVVLPFINSKQPSNSKYDEGPEP